MSLRTSISHIECLCLVSVTGEGVYVETGNVAAAGPLGCPGPRFAGLRPVPIAIFPRAASTLGFVARR